MLSDESMQKTQNGLVDSVQKTQNGLVDSVQKTQNGLVDSVQHTETRCTLNVYAERREYAKNPEWAS